MKMSGYAIGNRRQFLEALEDKLLKREAELRGRLCTREEVLNCSAALKAVRRMLAN